MSPSPQMSLAMNQGVAAGWSPPAPGMLFNVVTNDILLANQIGRRTGVGDSIADSGANGIITDAAGSFLTTETGMYVKISGCTNPDNNGTFLVSARTTTTLTYNNSIAVNETSSFTWELCGRASSIIDRVGGYNFAQATDANRPVVFDGQVLGYSGGGGLINPSKLIGNPAAAIRYLSLTNAAVAGALNGAQDFSFGMIVQPITIGTGDWMSVTDGISLFDNSIRFRANTNLGYSLTLAREQANVISSGIGSWGSGTTYMMYVGCSYDAITGDCDQVNGLFNNAQLNSIAPVTPLRNPTGMTITALGPTSSGGTGLFAAFTASNVKWSLAQHKAVYNDWQTIYGTAV